MVRFASLLSVLALSGAAVAQTQWINFPAPSAPSNRAGHDFVATRGAAVLFGGETVQNAFLNDTWTWDGRSLSWTQVTTAVQPTARAAFEMAYDPIRDRVVLFGGWLGGLYSNETWEWDGLGWNLMTPANAPVHRDWTAMEFDPISQRVILFGGHTTTGWPNVPNAFGDTWAWDGTNWTQLQPANQPFMRFGHEMTLDTKRNRIVMWGGASRQSGSVPAVNHFETWEWTGADWQQITTANMPTANTFYGMAYDSRRERIVVWGGVVSGASSGEVWEYDGVDWTQRTLVGTPVAISHGDGIFDPHFGQVVNFGGAILPNRSQTSGATDIYGAVHDASVLVLGSGCAGTAGTPVLDASHLAWVGGSYRVDLTSAPANAPVFFLVGFSATQTGGGLPLPFNLGVVGMTGCSLYVDPMVTAGASADASGFASLSLAVPNQANLATVWLHSQCLLMDGSANALGITASNGVSHRIGSR